MIPVNPRCDFVGASTETMRNCGLDHVEKQLEDVRSHLVIVESNRDKLVGSIC